MKIYRIRDLKQQLFLGLWAERTDQSAMRAFQSSLTDPQNPGHKWPEDYELYRVGTESDETGEITPESPVKIWSGSEAAAPRSDHE